LDTSNNIALKLQSLTHLLSKKVNLVVGYFSNIIK